MGVLHEINKTLKRWGVPEFYVGYSSQKGIYVDDVNNHIQPAPTPTKPMAKPMAFKRNVAQQGGMTKEQVQDFNLEHPNEIAIGGYNG